MARRNRRVTGRVIEVAGERKSVAPYRTLREPRVVPSEREIEERDRRVDAPYRDLTGSLLGDPRKGYSALDRA